MKDTASLFKELVASWGASPAHKPGAVRTGEVSPGDPQKRGRSSAAHWGVDGRAGCWAHNQTQTLCPKPSSFWAGEFLGELGAALRWKETGSCLAGGRDSQAVLRLPPPHS